MTAQQYLLSQAEHCRRSAGDQADPFVAEALRRLADEFERKAENASVRPPTRAAYCPDSEVRHTLQRIPERTSGSAH